MPDQNVSANDSSFAVRRPLQRLAERPPVAQVLGRIAAPAIPDGRPDRWRATTLAARSGDGQLPERRPAKWSSQWPATWTKRTVPAMLGYSYAISAGGPLMTIMPTIWQLV